MNANFEYNRLHARSKILELQKEGIRNQQLKQPKTLKTSAATKTQARQWFKDLKIKLLRQAYS